LSEVAIMYFCFPSDRVTVFSSPHHIKHLQAVPHPVGVVLGDVVEFRQLRPAITVAIDPLGYDAEIPVDPLHHIAIASLALPLHGVVQLVFVIDSSQVCNHQWHQLSIPKSDKLRHYQNIDSIVLPIKLE